MSSTTFPPVYDELVDVLAEDVAPERLLKFRLSPHKQKQLDGLLVKNRDGTLDPAEAAELEAYAQFEHVVRMLKARVRKRFSKRFTGLVTMGL